MRAREENSDAEIAIQVREVNASTRVGRLFEGDDDTGELPAHCPDLLSPQQNTSPSLLKATEWRAPAATDTMNTDLRSSTRLGDNLSCCSDGMPSCPKPFEPQA